MTIEQDPKYPPKQLNTSPLSPLSNSPAHEDELAGSMPFSLSDHRYAFHLDSLERAISVGQLEEIAGYGSFSSCSVLGFDLYTGSFVEGGNDYDEVDEKLCAAFGEDYSLRYTIVELPNKVSR